MTTTPTPAATPAKQPARAPDHTFDSGAVHLAVWDNAVTEADGSTRIQRSCRFEKRIFDEEQKCWRSTTALFPSDFMAGCLVFLQAALALNVHVGPNASQSSQIEQEAPI